jgi:hypothetical protein
VADETNQPTGREPAQEESTRGLRGLAALLALALAFAAAVLIVLAVDTADQKIREDCVAAQACTEYFDGGSAQKAATVVFLGLGGAFGVAGVIVCMFVAATGAASRWMLPVTGMAILFGAIGVVVANV